MCDQHNDVCFFWNDKRVSQYHGFGVDFWKVISGFSIDYTKLPNLKYLKELLENCEILQLFYFLFLQRMGKFGKSRLRKGISIVASMVLLLSTIMPTVPVFAEPNEAPTCGEGEFLVTFTHNDSVTETSYKCTTNKKILKADFPTCEGGWFKGETMTGTVFTPSNTNTLNQNITYLCNTTEFYTAIFKYNDGTTQDQQLQSDVKGKISNVPICLGIRFLGEELDVANWKGNPTSLSPSANNSIYTCNTEYSAKIGDTLYKNFSDAVTAASGTSIITLLKMIEYTMSENETLIVDNYTRITVNAPEGKVVSRAYSSNPKSYTFTVVDPVAKYQDGEVVKYYSTLSDAVSAATSGSIVTLLVDSSEGRISVGGQFESKNIIIDLGGNTLTLTASYDALLYPHNKSDSSLVIRNGKIIFNNNQNNACGIRLIKSTHTVTLESTLTLEAGGTTSPVCVFKGNLTTEANMSAENSFAIAGNGSAGYTGYQININGGSITSENASAIYHPNDGTLNINEGAIIQGATAVYVKAGTTNINGGSLVGNGAKADYTYNGNGAHATADALVVDSCGYPGGTPTVNINGGTLTSTNNKAIGYYKKDDTVENPVVYASTNDESLLHDGYMRVVDSQHGYRVVEACDSTHHRDETANEGEGACVAEKIDECTPVASPKANADYTTTGAYTWENDQWNAPECELIGCSEGYHEDGDQCVAEKIDECTPVASPKANADYTTTGAYTWENDQWNAPECELIGCSEGYHEDGDQCVANIHPEDIDELMVPDSGTTVSAGSVADVSLDNAEATTGFDANDYAGVTTPQIIIQQMTDSAALQEEGTTETKLENDLTNDFVTDTGKIAEMQGILDIKLYYLDGSGNSTLLSGVQFSDPVKIMIPVAASVSAVEVRADHGDGYGTTGLTLDGTAGCNGGVPTANAYTGGDVPVVNGKAEIYTCSASSFVAYTETDKPSPTPSNKTSGGSGGGGSSRTSALDDTKATTGNNAKLDGMKVDETKSEENNDEDEDKVAPMTETQAVEKFGQEQIDAYKWALENGITTMKTVESARLDEPLTRAELAKMMVVYIQKVLKKDPVVTGDVNYPDVKVEEIGDLVDFVKLAYQYQIMGINADGTPIELFNPHGIVSRGEYATVFSRVLFGAKFNKEGADFYTNHLEALKTAGILTNTLPSIQEMRGWVMLMMYRSSQNGEAIEKVATAIEENKDEVKAEKIVSEETVNVSDEEKSEGGIDTEETTKDSTEESVSDESSETPVNTAEATTGDALSE